MISIGAVDVSTFQKPNQDMVHFTEQLIRQDTHEPHNESDTQNLKEHVSDAKFYVFVSFAMGEQSINQIVKSAKRHGATIVLRGLYKNSMRETIAKLADAAGIIIDPTLFEKYTVTSVPTFILCNEDKFDVLRGNVSIKFALEQFASSGDLKEYAKSRL